MKRLLLLPSLMLSMSAVAYPVAGMTPDQRPENAPVIKAFKKPVGWYAQALHGVEQPYPPSFSFLEDQGGWYTPFIYKGMTGPYDIRHWHKN